MGKIQNVPVKRLITLFMVENSWQGLFVLEILD